MEVTCFTCTKKFSKKTCIAVKQKKHFCSRSCFFQYRKSDTRNYFQCHICGQQCYKRPSEQKAESKYCSIKCTEIGRNKAVERQCVICRTLFEVIPAEASYHKCCSKKCSNTYSKRNQQTIKCEQCSIPVIRSASQIKKHVFCSNRCKSKWYAKFTTQKRRSKAEGLLTEMIGNDYPRLTLIPNSRTLLPCGYEIDIYIKEKNLAIEINGPCHYFNIYGNLATVQQHDVIKHKEILTLGMKLLIIDIAGVAKIEQFMQNQYLENVKPLLE